MYRTATIPVTLLRFQFIRCTAFFFYKQLLLLNPSFPYLSTVYAFLVAVCAIQVQEHYGIIRRAEVRCRFGRGFSFGVGF